MKRCFQLARFNLSCCKQIGDFLSIFLTQRGDLLGSSGWERADKLSSDFSPGIRNIYLSHSPPSPATLPDCQVSPPHLSPLSYSCLRPAALREASQCSVSIINYEEAALTQQFAERLLRVQTSCKRESRVFTLNI